MNFIIKFYGFKFFKTFNIRKIFSNVNTHVAYRIYPIDFGNGITGVI